MDDPQLLIAAHYNRSEAYLAQKRYASALRDINAVIRLKPDGHFPYYRRAYIRWKNTILGNQDGRTRNAILDDLNKAIDHSGGKYRYFNFRGLIHMEMNKIDDAISDYTAAIKHNPEAAQAYEYRASLYMQKKEWDKAKADSDKSAALVAAGKR